VPVGKEEFESIVEAMGENQSELMKFSYNFYDLMLDPSKIDDESSSEPPADNLGPEQPESATEPESPEPDAEAGEESDQAKKEFEEYANKSEVARGLTEIISVFDWENEQEKNSALNAAKMYLTSYVENALDGEVEIDVDVEDPEGLRNYINNLISESKKSGGDDGFEDIDDESNLPTNSYGFAALEDEEKQILKSKNGLMTAISNFAKTNFKKLVADYKEEKRKEAAEEEKNAGYFSNSVGFRRDSIKDVLKTFGAENANQTALYVPIGEILEFLKTELATDSVREGISDFIGGMKDKFNLRGLKSALVNNKDVTADNGRKITPKMFENKKFRRHLLALKKNGMSDENIVKLIKYFLAANFNLKRAVDQAKQDDENAEWSDDSLQESLKPIIEAMLKQHYKH